MAREERNMNKVEDNMHCECGKKIFHVVAVDDSAMHLKMIEKLLKRCKTLNMRVTTLENPQMALEYLKENKVDMIISDYSMPVMTGYDLLKTIKQSSALKDIPVVIMSSENVMSRINRCMEQGAEDFLLKPLNIPKLGVMFARILKKMSRDTHYACSLIEADEHHHHCHGSNVVSQLSYQRKAKSNMEESVMAS